MNLDKNVKAALEAMFREGRRLKGRMTGELTLVAAWTAGDASREEAATTVAATNLR
jgi:hypothetical protein